MSSPEITDDDESFERPQQSKRLQSPLKSAEPVTVISDDDSDRTIEYISSDEESDLPNVVLQVKKEKVIKNLFPGSISKHGKSIDARLPPTTSNQPSTSNSTLQGTKVETGHIRMIGGVRVNFPVPPYGAQIALMAKVSLVYFVL